LAATLAGAWYLASRPALSASRQELGRPLGPAGPAEMNLLVITLDTTRADRVGPYGFQNVETPALDRLARDGVVFEHAMSVAPLTLPAHCSIFTGRFPPEHGVRDNGGFFLSPRQTTLASILRQRGFQTGAVVGAFVLDGKWGLNQGFQTYIDEFELPEGRGFSVGEVQRTADDVVNRALPWLEKAKAGRFFAWLHFYDPHGPYEPPEPFASRYGPHPYLGEIAFTDAQVARVVEFLERNGLLDRTIVAVMGDHGESLGQHGEGTHGFFVYESTQRVPFIVRAPFDRLRGRRVADPVRAVDLMPTVLDLLGIAPPRTISGVSLVPLMTGARATLDLEGYAEALYPLHHFGWADARAWRAGRYKVIDAPRPELYDLERDPHEGTNLYGERRTVADAMITRLRDRSRDAGEAAESRAAPEVDTETRARLAALGYVGSFVATITERASGRADPKDKIHLFNLMVDAREIRRDQQNSDAALERAIRSYQQVVAEDPNVIDAWFNLGNLHARLRRYPEAIAFFRKALALKPDYDLPVVNMANAYRQMGQDDAALAGYEHYLTIDPKNAHVRYQMGEIYLAKNDRAKAEENFRLAVEINPREASALNALGVMAFQRGNLDEAERQVRGALAAKSTVRLAHYNLALIAEERNDLAAAEAEYKKELEAHADAYKAAFNLGRLYERLGNRPAQIAALRQSVDRNPEFAAGRIFLAKACLDAGTDFAQAIDLARQGLALEPTPEIAELGHYVLADLYNRTGRTQDAAREVAAARRLAR
jgi:arylsulfatase A-like enzyme/Flp pilus assembly protein TadD